ncbi:hypothetical protein RUND412_009282 [Rhizina undulata]
MGYLHPGLSTSLYIRGRKRIRDDPPPPSDPASSSQSKKRRRTLTLHNHNPRLTPSPSPTPPSSPRRPPQRKSKLRYSYTGGTTTTPRLTSRLTPERTGRKLSMLESLPTEIVQKIFLMSLNPGLSGASVCLMRMLATTTGHLQRGFLRLCLAECSAEEEGEAGEKERERGEDKDNDRGSEAAEGRRKSYDTLQSLLKMRFITPHFLTTYERLHGPLRLPPLHLPPRLLLPPYSRLLLASFLLSRGAVLGPEDMDVFLSSLHSAISSGRTDVVEVLLKAGLRVDTESLRIAVDVGDARVCAWLVESGAERGDAGVWRRAIGRRREGRGGEVLAWLMRGGVPPGEVLGELVEG